MDEAFLRFAHLPEQVFEELDFKSLTNSRLVAISWKEFIDEREHKWYPFKNEIADLKKNCRKIPVFYPPFHLACINGQEEIAEIIIKNSAKLNIDLNLKDDYGRTAFHFACTYDHSKISDMLIKNSAELNIDLNVKNYVGMTAFHVACKFDQTRIVDMMINTSESTKIDLTATDENGWTGFQVACFYESTKVVNLIQATMPKIAF